MKPDSENFEALHKLIALKRYEQPPPGYFHRLPGAIITRIECGEGNQTVWEKITTFFIMRPAVAWALGVAACGIVALDVVWVKTRPKDSLPTQGMTASWVTVPPSALADNTPFDPSQPLHVANWLKDTNPTASAQLPSLFAPSGQTAIPTDFAPSH